MPDDAYARAAASIAGRGPGRMVPDLSRITELAALLGDPQLAYPSVHVTGTNGKGSTVRMVEALCAAAGLSAGTYTSPHLQSITERLSLAGRPISTRRFAEVHDEVAPFAELLDARARQRHGPDAHRVTYFEMLTAMAYAWFADAPVDVGVFEVGMGGRWDATNLVRGEVAVLSDIDVDHVELGSTAEEVASEKVGIIKPGGHVVSARQSPGVRRVVEEAAAAAGAPVWWCDEDLALLDQRMAVGGQQISVRIGRRVVDELFVPLHGAHQGRNALLALGAFAALTGEAFDAMGDDVLHDGLASVAMPGRLEVVRHEPTVLLDGAHNPHGARALAEAMGTSFAFRELILVVACLDDKNISGILTALREVPSHVIVTHAHSPRAASLERMLAAALETWQATGVVVDEAPDLELALDAAEAMAGDDDGILVTGSLHTVGGARNRYVPFVEDAAMTSHAEPQACADLDLTR